MVNIFSLKELECLKVSLVINLSLEEIANSDCTRQEKCKELLEKINLEIVNHPINKEEVIIST